VIPVSDLYQEAMRYSRTMSARMDIVYNDVVLENDVPLVTGSVSTDRGSNIRYQASADMGMYPWDSLPLDADGTRIRLYYGLNSLGTTEFAQVGEYQVFDFGRTNRGSLKLTLKGLEQFLIEAQFIRPRTPPYGVSTISAISDLIYEVLPTSEVVALHSTDRLVQATGAWEKDRWAAIDQLARSINCEVFCGHDGRFYIVDLPDLPTLVGQYQLDGGPTGVMITESRTKTRDTVYNAVSVSSNSSDQTVPPLWAWAYDSDPASRTYFYGPYGQRVRFYSSQFFTTTAQCQAYADRLLAESLAPRKSLSIGGVPIPFLEAGDPVRTYTTQTVNPSTTPETYLIQKTSLPFRGAWSAEMLVSTDVNEEAA
jgi:hypothetical protein